ncbi:interaptin isoform X2 [Cryptotermes secundus]|nr:interaptin isoform X2 [Cryptotermes secundus]
MKTRIRRLEMEVSKKQKIINNLNMLLSKQQVDNKLIANLKTDLEAARQHTRKCKFKQVMTTELVTRPGSIASTETQTDVNMDDLDADGVLLIKARNEVLRLGKELVEKDTRITEYESELHSQREQAKKDNQRNDEIIQALERELEVQREKFVTRPKSTDTAVTQTSVNMADLDASGAHLITARNEVQRLRNELIEKDERITEYESELHSQREQAKKDNQRNDEIIQALERELEVQREKILRYGSQTTLHDDQYKTGVINTEINSLECRAKSNHFTVRSTVGDIEVLKTERDALELEVENLQSLREEVAALSEQLDNVIMERDQLTQERDDLILESERQAAVLEAMQKDNDALKHETEYLQGQCNNVAAIKEQLKTVTAEQQHLKEVRDNLQLQMEHLQGQCKDIAEMTEERNKCQASGTKALEKARDTLKLETNVLQGQCNDAAALKEQLNTVCVTTVLRPKLREWRRGLLVIVTVLIFCFIVLLWTQRYSLNTYGTPFASLYKTSPSCKSILGNATPSRNIVV